MAPSGGLHVYALVWGEEAGRITARLFIDGRLKHEVTEDAGFAENLRYDDVLLRIGQRAWADSGFFIGDLGEVLFYDEGLSFQQINNVGAYLAQKYAIDAEFLFALAGDLNGDGFVGSDDLDIVRVNWGASVEPGRWDPRRPLRRRHGEQHRPGCHPRELGKRNATSDGSGARILGHRGFRGGVVDVECAGAQVKGVERQKSVGSRQ